MFRLPLKPTQTGGLVPARAGEKAASKSCTWESALPLSYPLRGTGLEPVVLSINSGNPSASARYNGTEKQRRRTSKSLVWDIPFRELLLYR